MKHINFYIFFIFAFILFSCGRHDNKQLNSDVVNNPATASGTKKENSAAFKFESELHDFGKVAQGEKVSFAFKFKNVGKSDLLIADAYGSCGCTIPTFSNKPIAPGADGIIEVLFNTEGKSGNQEKTVTIIANTVPNEKQIKIRAFVQVPEENKK